MAVEQKDVGQRNSPYRGLSEVLLGPPVKIFHRLIPGVKAKHITDLGFLLAKGGIELMEKQHRLRKYSPTITKTALGLVAVGLFFDLFDGELARLIRSEMTDNTAKLEDEREGQTYDPERDGALEALQSRESAITAFILGRRWGVKAAILSLITGNFARTAKSLTGAIRRIPVPENYPIFDLRTPGVSIGRKLLYVATFMPRIPFPILEKFPLQEVIHIGVGISNLWVTGERLKAIIDPPSVPALSVNEVDFAKFRAYRLGLVNITNIGMALDLVRSLNSKNSKP